MQDKSWMLNPTAISQARNCIDIVQKELGVKLKLSHPQFLELIVEYIELTDSQELADAYNGLAAFSNSNLQAVEPRVVKAKVTSIAPKEPLVNRNAIKEASDMHPEDMVEYHGKFYRRFSGDAEFKGLYRGQARYA